MMVPSRALVVVAVAAVAASSCAGSSGVLSTSPTPTPVVPASIVFGTLSGQVFKDLNGNGRADPGEPRLVSAGVTCVNSQALAGLSISWTGAATGNAQIDQCDSGGGFFRIDNLPAGAYTATLTF